jgi:ATP-dependent RNA helicase DeaD
MVLGDKLGALIRVLEVEDPESAIIFCNTKAETETVARHLCSAGFNADWLNGDLPQREREQIMKRTREGKLRYMVATDVAARGIDISHLTHVINFGFPETAEQYVHRTGRTGRAGRTGTAISVLGPSNLGALYYLRLTYKIFPIERSLPSETEVRTRQEADRLALLTEAFQGTPLDEHRDIVRRLLTHADAERVLSGLVRSFFASVSFDVDEAAAAARRERSLPPPLHPEEPEEQDEPAMEVRASELEPINGDVNGRRRRRRRRGREAQPEAEATIIEELPPEPPLAFETYSSALPEEPPPELENMITLYFNVGKRDGLEAKDLAGLLTSACELGMEDIGRVRVKDRHTFVGVPSERAEAIITSLEGQMIRSRSLHVERART